MHTYIHTYIHNIHTYITYTHAYIHTENELSRGGQVYWVAPRISDLEPLAARVHFMFPDARCAI
jgi:transcription-repair coupling factor (superfamily II helicase)